MQNTTERPQKDYGLKSQMLSSELPSEIPNEAIEEQTKKIPNLVFLGLAGASMVGSALLTFGPKKSQRRLLGNFIGLWVPTLLLLGVYNKLVKVEDEVLKGHAQKMH